MYLPSVLQGWSLYGDDETECLQTWRRALEDRGIRISRPKTKFIDITFGQGNGQGRDNINCTESECSMGKLEEMQWSVVRQEDASEAEGEGVHNCGQTSSAVWCRDMGNNEKTRTTTRSK